MQCLSDNNNDKLAHLYNVCHKHKQSPSGLNVARIACEYETKTSDIQQRNMLSLKNKFYVASSKDLGDERWKIDFMNELIDDVNKTAVCRLSPEEAKDILWFLASD